MNLEFRAKRYGFVAGVALSTAVLAAAPMTASAAGQGESPSLAQKQVASPFTLVNGVSGRCMDDPGYVTTNGTQIALWDCNGGVNQKWTGNGSGTLTIGGKCLDVANGATGAHTPGTRAVLWDCNGSPTQNWLFNPNQSTPIKNASSGLCLDTAMAQGTPGVPVVMWNCGTSSPSQAWTPK
ncbi:RICIN domain-containing protein [Streptomyces luteireticuli]|uniref:Ricin B lectin domain-containing protein n=1 Tax=Streptomyces luteireticuli TaxID=173858 RepID=A0ABP3IQ87_9ACTN